MPDVRITIDGREISVPAGSTLLDAAKAAGIDIPTLCDHPAIEPIGACRVCLVEIEKQRVLQPACTFPVSEGMVVHTDTQPVLNSRRFVLQLLFSERNHYCMFCQMSGSCELQDLAYANGLDHWEYDRGFPKMAVDASREFFVMDHNRCILCRRCIRACDERVGNSTLWLKKRGAQTMIVADMDVPFGKSTCVSCGTCLQVCPTGALMDRASAYMGATQEVTRVKSRCMACSVGCGVELIVRGNRVIRVEGDWDAQPNAGLLCEIGRFHPLHEKRQRVRKPLVRGANGLAETTIEAALQAAAAQVKGAKVASLASGFITNEEGAALAKNVPGAKISMSCAPVCCTEPLSVLDDADLYVMVGADLGADHQVAGFAVKRAVRHRGARLLTVADEPSKMEPWAMGRYASGATAAVVKIAAGAQMPVIIYDACCSETADALAAQLPQAKKLALACGGNALGLAKAGFGDGCCCEADVVVVAAGEEPQADADLLAALDKARFVVVFASYRQPWDGVADVILPMPTTAEKSGTMTGHDGADAAVVAGVQIKAPSFVQLVEQLGALLK